MKLTLIEKSDEGKGAKSFFWQPEEKVDYTPGQYYYYTLPKLNYSDDRGPTRHFTISSSPTEGNLLRLTTRIREESDFKKILDELPIGSEIEGRGPQGEFTFDRSEKGPHVFLAGGIGITPFRSFIKFNIDKNLKIPMPLIYSNSDSDFVFEKELKEWSEEKDFIKIEYFDTSKSGHLDSKTIDKLVNDWSLDIGHCTFWASGPPSFVSAMESELEKMKISSENIRTDKFTGY